MRYTDRITFRASEELRRKLTAKATLDGHSTLSITARVLLERAMKCKPLPRKPV